MSYLREVITGDYELRGELTEADSVIAQSFGYREDNGEAQTDPVNCELAKVAYSLSEGVLPIIAQVEVARCLPDDTSVKTIEKHRNPSKYLDTWEVLLQTKEIMDELELKKPIVVAHSFHIGRVATQAKKIGIDPIVLPGMPRKWDAESQQPWTRNRNAWSIFQIIGHPFLVVQEKI